MGATGFGYDLAETFGLKVTPTRPALVPLTFDEATLARLKPLAGISLDARVSTVAPGKTAGKPSFAAPVSSGVRVQPVAETSSGGVRTHTIGSPPHRTKT